MKTLSRSNPLAVSLVCSLFALGLGAGCTMQTEATDDAAQSADDVRATQTPAYYSVIASGTGYQVRELGGWSGPRRVGKVVVDDAGTVSTVLENLDGTASSPVALLLGTLVHTKGGYDFRAYDTFLATESQQLGGGRFYRITHGTTAQAIDTWSAREIRGVYDARLGKDAPLQPWCAPQEGGQKCLTDFASGLIVYGVMQRDGFVKALNNFPSLNNLQGGCPPGIKCGRGRGLFPVDYLSKLSSSTLIWMYYSGQITLAEARAAGARI